MCYIKKLGSCIPVKIYKITKLINIPGIQSMTMNIWFLMCVLMVVLMVQTVVALTEQKFHVMQKSVPREDFIRLSPAAPDAIHELVFSIQQKGLSELEHMLTDRSTPGNPFYQQWLSYDQIGEITSNLESAQEIKQWLTSNGATITWISTNSHYIKAEAQISLWESLLNTKFSLWEDRSRMKNKNKISNKIHRATEYSLPLHIKSHVSAVFNTVQVPPSLHSKYHTRESSEFRTDMTVTKSTTTSTGTTTNTNNQNYNNKDLQATNGKVTVSFLNDFYEITTNSGSSSLQQSVFETAEESYSPTDLTLFQQTYNLPVQSALHPYGFNTSDCVSNDCYEGNLDIQYIMGIAQQTVSIYWYVQNTNTSDPFVDWIVDVANTTNPPLVNSISWGSIEQVRVFIHIFTLNPHFLSIIFYFSHTFQLSFIYILRRIVPM